MSKTDQPVQLRPAAVRVSVWAVLGAWLARRLARLTVLLVRSPAALVTVALWITGWVVWRSFGPVPVVVAVGVFVGGLVGWRLRWPAGFQVQVRLRVRGWLRGFVYRAWWRTAMTSAGLAVPRGDSLLIPDLRTVTSTKTVDRCRLRMLPGQTLTDYADVADRLAQTFGVEDCRIRSVPRRPHQLMLWLLVRDPLTATVEVFPADLGGLEAGIPVARGEDGSVFRLRIVGHHILIVGATGAGKGSVLWSLLVGLVPFIEAGLVKVWALDPKGGMELAPGRRLFDRFAHGDSTTSGGYETSFALLLEDAVTIMRARQDRLRGVTRLHTPSTAEPLIVVVVDELAALTGWVVNRDAKRRIEAALGLLLSQGRAVGVVVVGAVQDPRKDVLPLRDLFPTRVGLRLNEAEQVGLVFGPGARNRGAACDLIPDTLPGVGYVLIEGIAEPVRVRFSHVTDDHIDTLGADPGVWSGPVLAISDEAA